MIYVVVFSKVCNLDMDTETHMSVQGHKRGLKKGRGDLQEVWGTEVPQQSRAELKHICIFICKIFELTSNYFCFVHSTKYGISSRI